MGDWTKTREDLACWKAGDPAGFDRVWARYLPSLELCVRRQIRQIADPSVRAQIEAEDVLQDAAMVAMRKLSDFEYRGTNSLFGWIQTIARHMIQDYRDRLLARKRGLHQRQSLSSQEDSDNASAYEPKAPQTGPATKVERAEDWERVAAVIIELPQQEFQTIVLRNYHGAEWSEIAEYVGASSPDAVRKEHARLLERIGGQLRGRLPT